MREKEKPEWVREREKERKTKGPPSQSRQMSLKVAQIKDFDSFKKFPKNVVDSDKIIVATGFENLPKAQ